MFKPITKKNYISLLELDKKVYPTYDPVTPKILNKWFANNPEFGIIIQGQEYEGMCICIPLNKKGWKSLISGELLEKDLDENYIFDNSRDNEIGIHIYHIEKLKGDGKLYQHSLEAIKSIIFSLKEENPSLNIVGFSGLCVTSSGIGLFYNKFNCRERYFINSEHILKKGDNLEIFDSESRQELSNKLREGYEYINRCKMLVLYPNEPSIVWDYIG